MLSSVWTEERVTLLKEGVAENISFSLIADKINRDTGANLTRASAIGKAHRLGLCLSMKDRVHHGGDDGTLARFFRRIPKTYRSHVTGEVTERTGEVTEPKRRRSAKKRQLRQTKETRPSVRQFKDAQPELFLSIAFLDLEPHHCRFPHGGDGGQPITFCGQPKAIGSYCGYHAAVCLTPNVKPDPREEKPQRNYYAFNSARVA